MFNMVPTVSKQNLIKFLYVLDDSVEHISVSNKQDALNRAVEHSNDRKSPQDAQRFEKPSTNFYFTTCDWKSNQYVIKLRNMRKKTLKL